MEKSDDITAPSAQSPRIPQDNVLHSPLGMRLDEALSSVSDWTEEMGLQMECQTVFLKAGRCCHHSPQQPYSECIVQVGLAPASNY